MNFCTAVKILILVCSEQEGEPNKMIMWYSFSETRQSGQEVWSDKFV